MNFKDITKKYEKNYFEIQKLDLLLEDGNDFDSWLNKMKKRASMLQKYYAENNNLIQEAQEYSNKPFEYLNEEIELEEEIDRLY